MSPFVPTGYLSFGSAIDRVVELMQAGDPSLLLTEEQRTILRDLQERRDQVTGREPREAVPVTKVGQSISFAARTPTSRAPGGHVEVEPPRPSVAAEEVENLLRKEAYLKEQRPAAGEVLRQLLYAGRVPSKTITNMGYRIKTPKHVWGGNWWYIALKRNTIQHAHGLGVSVLGRPVIRRDALEAAFNPDGTVKEGPEPVAQEATVEGAAEQSGRGRKPKWDWDGAVGYLLLVANKPDGLPVNQAEIERLVADWFSETVDGQPVESAIRKHVSAWCEGVLGKASNSPTSN